MGQLSDLTTLKGFLLYLVSKKVKTTSSIRGINMDSTQKIITVSVHLVHYNFIGFSYLGVWYELKRIITDNFNNNRST